MSQTVEHPPSHQILQQGYQPDEVSNRGLLIFFAAFILTAIVLHWGLWELVKYYCSVQRPVDRITSAAPAQKRFPAPNLQPTEAHNHLPYQDLDEMKQQEAQFFQTIGWPTSGLSGEPAVPDSVAQQLERQRNEPQEPGKSQGNAERPNTAVIGGGP